MNIANSRWLIASKKVMVFDTQYFAQTTQAFKQCLLDYVHKHESLMTGRPQSKHSKMRWAVTLLLCKWVWLPSGREVYIQYTHVCIGFCLVQGGLSSGKGEGAFSH